MLIKNYDFQIFADYHQFYLEDENAPHIALDLWDDEAHERQMATEEGLIVVGTARNTTVPVSVEIYDCEPDLDAENFSRINECSLKVVSNKLIILGCSDFPPDAERIEIEPHVYRVRVLYGNLENAWEDCADFYRLQLWKDAQMRDVLTLKS